MAWHGQAWHGWDHTLGTSTGPTWQAQLIKLDCCEHPRRAPDHSTHPLPTRAEDSQSHTPSSIKKISGILTDAGFTKLPLNNRGRWKTGEGVQFAGPRSVPWALSRPPERKFSWQKCRSAARPSFRTSSHAWQAARMAIASLFAYIAMEAPPNRACRCQSGCGPGQLQPCDSWMLANCAQNQHGSVHREANIRVKQQTQVRNHTEGTGG